MYILKIIKFQNALRQTLRRVSSKIADNLKVFLMHFTSGAPIVPLASQEELFRAVTQTVSSQITKYVR